MKASPGRDKREELAEPLPSRLRRATFPKGTAFRGGDKLSGSALRRPLGGAGCERSEQTEGVLPAAPERVFNRKNDKKYNISAHLRK